MKNNFLKGILAFIFLMSNVMLFAQTGPGSEDSSGLGNLEGNNDPLPSTIDSETYILLFVGIGFAMYFINEKLKVKRTT
ncbi:MAG: hypothetical protein RL308_713 [Bacteroidota bacterium]|jgi:hypothetical protein